ncbi:hypothetical protein B7992_07580 [Fibrobacter sp. UWH1]|nr:hypothetical protein B7992_07580 [Fibrobacter sp. UWH1]
MYFDNSKPYHKIVGIQLDVKSVMRNYRRNEIAQFRLAEVVKEELSKIEKSSVSGDMIGFSDFIKEFIFRLLL